MRTSRRFREIVFLVIGVTTPIGILVVNGAAFVMAHLTEFRFGIASAALVSSLLLNGLTAWWLLGLAGRNAPLLYQEYKRWAIAGAVLIVLVTSAGAAYFSFIGMRDPRRLPDAIAMITASLALLVPFAITYIGRRLAGIGGVAPVDDAESMRPRQGVRKRTGRGEG